MCCLFGVLGNHINTHEIDLLRYQSYLSCFRGVDSTGLMLGVRGKRQTFEVDFAKDILTPPEFIHSSDIEGVLDKAKNLIFAAGHSRAATRGAVTIANAHPFVVDDIIGMHNGTIYALTPKPGGTDSEEAISILSQYGVQELVNRSRHGAYAFVWADQERETLNFLRNKERPLWFMKAPGNIILWMSEKWMLETVAKYMKWPEERLVFNELTVDTHVVFKFGETACKAYPMAPKVEPVVIAPWRNKEREKEEVDKEWVERHLPGLRVEDLFKDTGDKSIKGIVFPKVYPYWTTQMGKNYVTKPSASVPLLPPPTATATRRSLRLVGPTSDSTPEEIKEYIKCGCVNCNFVPDVSPDTKQSLVKTTVFWLPCPAEPKNTLFFCFDCKVNKKEHAMHWNLDDKDLVRGGLTYVKD